MSKRLAKSAFRPGSPGKPRAWPRCSTGAVLQLNTWREVTELRSGDIVFAISAQFSALPKGPESFAYADRINQARQPLANGMRRMADGER
jgi:hypothetical protein